MCAILSSRHFIIIVCLAPEWILIKSIYARIEYRRYVVRGMKAASGDRITMIYRNRYALRAQSRYLLLFIHRKSISEYYRESITFFDRLYNETNIT